LSNDKKGGMEAREQDRRREEKRGRIKIIILK